MNIIEELKQRNVINNITNEEKLKQAIVANKTVYIGFDPSFNSLHLGNYVMICLLNRLNAANIKTIAVIGGATGMIGDPSGKKDERKLIDQSLVAKNVEALTKQIKTLTNAEIINNIDIYKDMNLFDFLRNVGKLITVNYLLEKEIINSRLNSGISYAEFSYNLIQGYDFLWLYKNKNVAMQIGGSDQWGNITTGIEIIRKDLGDDNLACGFTINLLTKQDGTKFGKSESGAIYLDKNISSPYLMYQFLINQNDDDLLKLFHFFSFKSLSEINEIMKNHNLTKNLRVGQKLLAQEIIETIHGKKAYEQCEKIAKALFNDEYEKLDAIELEQGLKQFNFLKAGENDMLSDVLIANEIIDSKRIFRELLADGSLKVNNVVLINDISLKQSEAINKHYSIIKKGKKNYYVINWKGK